MQYDPNTGEPISTVNVATPIVPAEKKVYGKQVQITQIGEVPTIQYIDKKTGQQKSFNKSFFLTSEGVKFEVGGQSGIEWLRDRKIGETLEIRYEIKTNQGNNGQVYTNYNLVLPSLSERISVLENAVKGLIGGVKTKVAPVVPVAPVAQVAPVVQTNVEEKVPIIDIDAPPPLSGSEPINSNGNPAGPGGESVDTPKKGLVF